MIEWELVLIFGLGIPSIVLCLVMLRLEGKWDRDRRMGLRPDSRRAGDGWFSRGILQRKKSTTETKEGTL